MRAEDLPPPQRRLLRLAGRIDPNAFAVEPGEVVAVAKLIELGLLRKASLFDRPAAQITDAGRRAL